MNISIIGGGRWARTIAAVLYALPSRLDRVVIHSKHNAAGITAWIEALRLGDRLCVSAAWPHFGLDRDRPDAVIVANRVSDHFAAVTDALFARVPVLVEKPISLPYSRIVQLREIAESTGALLAASHIFLFAQYFEAFAKLVAALGDPRRLSFTWTDGPFETRRGEVKAYDPTVTLFDDILPHVFPMVHNLQYRDVSLVSFDIQRGGAELTLEARSNDGRQASLILARNGSGRRRIIEVETDNGTAVLDFSTEPGLILAPGIFRNGDPRWDSARRPLATMLTAFLVAVAGGPLDSRLSTTRALPAAIFADAVRGPYLAHQIQWLEKRLGEPLNEPLRYALKELAGDYAGGEAIEAIWSAMGSPAHLKEFLSKCSQMSDAAYGK